MNKKERARWFAGLKWAEKQVRIYGIKGFMQDVMVDNVFDFDSFDRGILDYLDHYKWRLQ